MRQWEEYEPRNRPANQLRKKPPIRSPMTLPRPLPGFPDVGLHGQSRDRFIERLANLLRQCGRGERFSNKVVMGAHDAKLADSVRGVT